MSYPENHYSLSPAGGDRVLPYRNPSASFSSPSSGLVSLSTMGPPGITPGPFVRYKPSPDRCVCVCVLFFFPTSPSLLWSWLNMSDMTHNTTLHFVCSSRIISVLTTRLNSVVWSSLQLDVYEHTVSQKDLLCGWLFLTVWRLITSRPTRKMCFYSTAIRMQNSKWNPPLLSQIKTVLGLS